MTICEFCINCQEDRECKLGLKIPKTMSCRDFTAGLESFCAKPTDFVNSRQIVEMATYFGLKGSELKKVKLMATQAESIRV